MEEVLPWLQSQLQLRVKGKKTERMRQWLAVSYYYYIIIIKLIQYSKTTEGDVVQCSWSFFKHEKTLQCVICHVPHVFHADGSFMYAEQHTM